MAFPDTVIFPDSLILNPEGGSGGGVGFLPRYLGLSVGQARLPQFPSMDGFGFSGTTGWSPACRETSGPSESPGRKDSQLVPINWSTNIFSKVFDPVF